MNDFTLLNNFFDHIYVLTLPRATERQTEFNINLAGLNFDFFWGVDKKDHVINELISNGIYDEQQAIKKHRYHKPFNGGQICCAWSHKKIYEDVIAKGYQKVLILEDDVITTEQLSTILADIFKVLPNNWELLYFDYNKNETPHVIKKYWYHFQRFVGALTWNHTTISNLYPKNIDQHIATAGYHDFTSAYAITSAAAKKLLQLQTPITWLADNLLAQACTTKLVNGFIVKPKLFTQLSQGNTKHMQSFVDD